MDITKKTGEHSTIILNVTMDALEVKSHEKAAIKKLSSEVKLDGFRKGHVPETMIRSRIGEMAIQQECIDLAINEVYKTALQSEKIIPLDRPEVKIESIDPLQIELIVPVYPEVSVSKTGLDGFSVANISVSDEEIDDTLKMFQKNFA